jgi:hypothetical protein
MAKAYEKQVPVQATEKRIVLELTEAEADALIAATGRVAGNVHMKSNPIEHPSPRDHIQNIASELGKATAKSYHDAEAWELCHVGLGGIQFSDYPEGHRFSG